MRRADVIAVVLAVVAGGFGVSAGTGPLAGGLAALVLAGLALRARTAHYVVVWAVGPLLVWAAWPDPSMMVASVALAACAIAGLLSARDRKGAADEVVIAGRITLATAMVVAASGLLTFDLLLR